MKNFKTWELIFKTNLVSNGHINPSLIHEAISKALRNEAGGIGYLVGEETMQLNQTSGTDE